MQELICSQRQFKSFHKHKREHVSNSTVVRNFLLFCLTLSTREDMKGRLLLSIWCRAEKPWVEEDIMRNVVRGGPTVYIHLLQ